MNILILKYTKDHEWIRIKVKSRVGILIMPRAIKDIVFVNETVGEIISCRRFRFCRSKNRIRPYDARQVKWLSLTKN